MAIAPRVINAAPIDGEGLTRLPPESVLVPIEQPDTQKAKDALIEWSAMAKEAYSKNTQRAQRADGAVFQWFCESAALEFFPASPMTIRAFVEHCVEAGKKPASIRRYVATIARAHLAAGLTSPCASEPVRLALKEMGQKTSARQRQALALGWKDIKEFIESAGDGCGRIGSGRSCAWLTTPWRGAASSWP